MMAITTRSSISVNALALTRLPIGSRIRHLETEEMRKCRSEIRLGEATNPRQLERSEEQCARRFPYEFEIRLSGGGQISWGTRRRWVAPVGSRCHPGIITARNFREPSRQRNRVIAEALVAGRRDEVIVLDADAADVVHVKARFERNDVAGNQRFRGMANEVRRLWVRDAEAVAGVVREAVGHSRE